MNTILVGLPIVTVAVGVVWSVCSDLLVVRPSSPPSPTQDTKPPMSKLTQLAHLMPSIANAVNTVEQVSQAALDSKMTSQDKLASAGAIVAAGLASDPNPALAPIAQDFAGFWPSIQSLISALVTVYNLMGIFKKKAA